MNESSPDSAFSSSPQPGGNGRDAAGHPPSTNWEFVTEEQRLARTSQSAAPYLRVEDPICADVLRGGVDESRFDATRAVFPFFRTGVVLRLPRTRDGFYDWSSLGFWAGICLGLDYPAKASMVVKSDDDPKRLEYVIGVIQEQIAAEEDITGVRTALEWLAAKFNLPPDGLDHYIATLSHQTIAAGCLAAIQRPHWAEEMRGRLRNSRLALEQAACAYSLSRAQGRSVYQMLEHPLLTVAWEKYPDSPRERAVFLDALSRFLEALGVRSEDECPDDDLAVAQWIDAGYAFGREISDTDTVQSVREELGSERIGGIRCLTQSILRGRTRFAVLDVTRGYLGWYKAAHDWFDPLYYGRRLERVIHAFDFAVWLGWLRLLK